MSKKTFFNPPYVIDDFSLFKEAEKSHCILFEPDDPRNLYLSLSATWNYGSITSTFFPTYIFYPYTPELAFFKLHKLEFKTTKFLYYRYYGTGFQDLQCKDSTVCKPVNGCIDHVRNHYLKLIVNRDSLSRARPAIMWPDRANSPWIYDIRNNSIENVDRENCHHVIYQPGFESDIIKEHKDLFKCCNSVGKPIMLLRAEHESDMKELDGVYTVKINQFKEHPEIIMQLIASAKMYVGIDCWVSHLAVTMGVPAVIFIKEDEMQKYRYVNDNVYYVKHPTSFHQEYYDKITHVSCQIAASRRPKRK